MAKSKPKVVVVGAKPKAVVAKPQVVIVISPKDEEEHVDFGLDAFLQPDGNHPLPAFVFVPKYLSPLTYDDKALVMFFEGTGLSRPGSDRGRGYTVQEINEMTPEQYDTEHFIIQTALPNPGASSVHHNAPRLTERIARLIAGHLPYRRNAMLMLERFLTSIGVAADDMLVVEARLFDPATKGCPAFTVSDQALLRRTLEGPGKHTLKRVSRFIVFSKLLGLYDFTYGFLDFLERCAAADATLRFLVEQEEPYGHWQDATHAKWTRAG